MQNNYLNHLRKEIEIALNHTKEIVGNLSEVQFNWKANPKSWSIAECLSHLIKVNKTYHPQLQKIMNPQKLQKVGKGFEEIKTTFFGRLLESTVNPATRRKTATLKLFKPASSNYGLSLLKDFESNIQDRFDMMEQMDGYNLNEIKISSPFLSWIRFNIGEYFRIETYHFQRHLNQIKRVLEEENFPKNNQ